MQKLYKKYLLENFEQIMEKWFILFKKTVQ